MTTATDPAVTRPALPPARHASLRLHLLLRSTGMMLTSMVGVALFCLWVTLVAVSPLTIVAALVLPATALVRGYANARRRGASRLLGRPVVAAYREPDRPGWLRRLRTVESDPASWRDALWLLVHAVVGCVTSTLAFTLFASSIFYAIYPFLFWVTPRPVFARPLGDWWVLHDVSQSFWVMALAPVTLGLWYVLQVPLTRAELAVTEALLGRR